MLTFVLEDIVGEMAATSGRNPGRHRFGNRSRNFRVARAIQNPPGLIQAVRLERERDSQEPIAPR